MKDIHELPPEQRALVSIAILLDGFDAGVFLDNDVQYQSLLKDVAEELSKEDPASKIPYVGTILRNALKELGQE